MPPLSESVWTWSHFFFGLTYGIVASFLFIFLLLWLLRPFIKIAPQIASHIDEHGKPCFRFKFYNCSLFDAHDVIVNLRIAEAVPASPYGFDVLVSNVELTTSKFPFMPRWRRQNIAKKTNLAPHCIQVKTYEDINAILSDKNKSLQIRVILKHELTGLSRNYISSFNKTSSIVKGEYEFGNSFTIK
jgi:hypothetical protein